MARLASKVDKVTDKMKESYSWSWSEHLSTGTERGAQQFLNIVSILGYIYGNLFNLDSKSLSRRRLRTRITTLPRAYDRLLLESESPDGQNCRPDFFALHRSSFVAESEREFSRISEYMEKSSILSTIAHEDGINSPDPDDDDIIGPLWLSITSEGYDELLDDVCNGTYSGNKGAEDTDASCQEQET
ncbi:hypothetical protein C0995_004419 [Termitomyces sp. Mi166|nr:hypothetical protein C0995_004419 [Termitomyces sp. Mi166\